MQKKVHEAINSENSSPPILIVDDDAQIRRLLRRILQGADYKIIEAAAPWDQQPGSPGTETL